MELEGSYQLIVMNGEGLEFEETWERWQQRASWWARTCKLGRGHANLHQLHLLWAWCKSQNRILNFPILQQTIYLWPCNLSQNEAHIIFPLKCGDAYEYAGYMLAVIRGKKQLVNLSKHQHPIYWAYVTETRDGLKGWAGTARFHCGPWNVAFLHLVVGV